MIEASHRACGWRTYIYTETAVSHDYGTATFFTDGDLKNLEWGGSIFNHSTILSAAGSVKKIRLADFIIKYEINCKPCQMSEIQFGQLLKTIKVPICTVLIKSDLSTLVLAFLSLLRQRHTLLG
jgi:hypothetical protein